MTAGFNDQAFFALAGKMGFSEKTLLAIEKDLREQYIKDKLARDQAELDAAAKKVAKIEK